jgi:hypothetical protein
LRIVLHQHERTRHHAQLVPLLILTAGFAAFKTLKATRPECPVAEIRERVWRVEVEEVAQRRLAP